MKRPLFLTVLVAVFGVLSCGEDPAGPTIVEGMARVSSGAFGRGCQPEVPLTYCWEDPDAEVLLDVPHREIDLSEFWIDQYETTREEWNTCVAAGVCAHTGASVPDASRPGLPAADMTWDAARSYCEFRGKRLSTEAEWEKAARGTDSRIYPWGNDLPECDTANMRFSVEWQIPEECFSGVPEAVDAHPKDRSPYGAMGMAGNVQEWVADWASQRYYEEAPSTDPPGPDVPNAGSTDYRIIRGTYWGADGGETYRRWWFAPDWSAPRIGVRCASSVHPDEINDPLAE